MIAGTTLGVLVVAVAILVLDDDDALTLSLNLIVEVGFVEWYHNRELERETAVAMMTVLMMVRSSWGHDWWFFLYSGILGSEKRRVEPLILQRALSLHPKFYFYKVI